MEKQASLATHPMVHDVLMSIVLTWVVLLGRREIGEFVQRRIEAIDLRYRILDDPPQAWRYWCGDTRQPRSVGRICDVEVRWVRPAGDEVDWCSQELAASWTPRQLRVAVSCGLPASAMRVQAYAFVLKR